MVIWIAEYNCSVLPKSAESINLKTVGYVLGKDRLSALRALARSLLGMKQSKEMIQMFKNPFLQNLFSNP